MVVLGASFFYQLRAGADRPPGLTDVLKPVNLFTGVFSCGLICLLNLWMDRRLPAVHRMPRPLLALNAVGGVAFILAGLRGYWVYAGWRAIGILLATLALGIVLTWFVNRARNR
jgi:hypothetical protein